MGIFGSNTVIEYQVVEVPPTENIEPTREIKEAVASLSVNPGFRYLLNRMAYLKAYLARQLESPQNTHDTDIWLKAGIYWADFLRTELTKSQPQKPPAKADETEEEIFRAAQAALEVVGL